jgi:hypothetical protein
MKWVGRLGKYLGNGASMVLGAKKHLGSNDSTGMIGRIFLHTKSEMGVWSCLGLSMCEVVDVVR